SRLFHDYSFLGSHPHERFTLSLHDALPISEDNVTSCAMQAFIAGYCEISLIKSVSERRNYFEPGTDEYYNRKANTSSVNTIGNRSEEHTSELQSRFDLVCRLLLEKKK